MFTKNFNNYVCIGDTIDCEVDGFQVTAKIYLDDNRDRPDERDEGFWPSKDPKAAGYVLPENYASAYAEAKETMRAWEADEWFYCGVVLTVWKHDVELVRPFAAALWGIDCNCPSGDNSYLMTVANELLGEALELARDKLAKLRAPDDNGAPSDQPEA